MLCKPIFPSTVKLVWLLIEGTCSLRLWEYVQYYSVLFQGVINYNSVNSLLRDEKHKQ
jgi:hypothetical protein